MDKFLISLCILWMTTFSFYPISAGFIAPKLPSTIIPTRYDITLEPNLDEIPATFRGNVTIDLKVLEETNNITLHASRLNLNEDDFIMKNANDEAIPITNIEIEQFMETCTIIFGNDLQKDENYELTITYSGELRNDNQGFYLAKYQDESGQDRLIATTSFTQTNARSAFPCFDEPAFKTPFNIKLIRPENYTALSNEERINTANLGIGRFLDVFKETCNMSTYLVAFTISQFAHTDKNGLHRIFAKPQDIKSGKTDYILKESLPTLEAVEKYVNMKYTFSKIDHLAIPSEYFTSEAMENWGLISYSDRTLLFSNNTSTTMDKQTSLTSMLHEFIHQWFGNLVTPSEWRYLWLSEGFATYLQFYIGDMIKPSWKLQDQFQNIILDRALEGENSYNREALSGRFPPQWVTYLKAAAIIRMTQHFLTPDIFQKGLQRYLKTNEFRAVNPSDLYAAFQTVIDEEGVGNLLGQNSVVDIMTSWDSVPTYPILKVTRNYEHGSVTMKQSIFTPFKFMENDDIHAWYIPINYVFNANSTEDFTKTVADYWLTKEVHTLDDSFTTEGWLIINKQFTGYYRVNYDTTNWNRLITFLKSPNFNKIHVLNRAQLLSDSFHLARHDELDYKIPLSLSTYLLQERDYVPLSTFFNAMELLNKCLVTSEIYPNFKNYIIDILSGVHEKLGYDENDQDDHLDKINRGIVISWLCSLGHAECREIALKKLRNWKANDNAIISPNVQEAVLCGAIRIGSQDDWNFLYSKYVVADKSEAARILKALSCSENEEIITKLLDKIRDTNVLTLNRADRTASLVAIIQSGPTGLKVTNGYIRHNFIAFYTLVKMDIVLNAIGDRLTTQEELEEFKSFKTQYGGVHMAFRPGMALARINIDWNTKHLPQITEWFNRRNNSSVQPKLLCNNGTCEGTGNSLRFNCLERYTGSNGQREINECESAPCQNGATCKDLIGYYACHCTKGFQGQNCELNVDDCKPNPCENGGTCHDLVDNFQCSCPPGTLGYICEINIDDCRPGACHNNGTCIDKVEGFECKCPPGFVGPRCEGDINECLSNPCSTPGTLDCVQLVNGYRCNCKAGYKGRHCKVKVEVNFCANSPCLNGGICTTIHAGHRCTCQEGFYGKNCEFSGYACDSDPCQNGGICISKGGGYECYCPKGTDGTNCELDSLNECDNNPCRHPDASCQDKLADYACYCPPKRTGKNCEIYDRNSPGGLGQSVISRKDTTTYYACDFDGNDCSLGINPWVNCTAPIKCWEVFMDGNCDEECYNPQCLFDGYDCEKSLHLCNPVYEAYCQKHYANGRCDYGCNSAECNWDGFDCENEPPELAEGVIVVVVLMEIPDFKQNLVKFLRDMSYQLRTTVRVKKDRLKNYMISEWDAATPINLQDTYYGQNHNVAYTKQFDRKGVKVYLEIDNRKCGSFTNADYCFQSAYSAANFLAAKASRHSLSKSFPISQINSVNAPPVEDTEETPTNVKYVLIDNETILIDIV